MRFSRNIDFQVYLDFCPETEDKKPPDMLVYAALIKDYMKKSFQSIWIDIQCSDVYDSHS